MLQSFPKAIFVEDNRIFCVLISNLHNSAHIIIAFTGKILTDKANGVDSMSLIIITNPVVILKISKNMEKLTISEVRLKDKQN